MKEFFYEFMASFECEFDTDFEEYTRTLHDVMDMISVNYGDSCYHLEGDEPKEEYKEVVERARKIYLEVKEFK